jgi:uncharacterized protein YqjF (DUF2071 family)
MQPAFLKAEWRKLAIANYSVEPSLLKTFLPYKTELDYWNDQCYISLVGFRFINTRLKGMSIPFHTNFEEINLRFYVRYKKDSEWRHGVTFIKEIVPRRALTFVANSIYKEKYVTLPTKYHWDEDSNDLKVLYQWKHRNKWDLFSLTASSVPCEISPLSKEEFITEHYWGYTQLNKSQTSQYQVEHPRWQVYTVKDYEINVQFGELYGSSFNFLTEAIPDSIMLAEGSKIVVRKGGKIS